MRKTQIVVAQSACARIFDVDPVSGERTEVAYLVHTQARAHERDLRSGRHGRTFDSVGRGRHTVSTHVSPHERETELFARRNGDWLEDGYGRGEFARLLPAAPTEFLGLLRTCPDVNIQAVLKYVINKILIHESPAAIAQHFFGLNKRVRATASR